MFDLAAVQAAVQALGVDGWLLYDFRGLNVLARRALQIPTDAILSRRWFYFVPATGEPRKLVHRIEPGALDSLPGGRQVYLRWQELEAGVKALVAGCRRVAMEYVPRNANPYVSRVHAGTVELVRSAGKEVPAKYEDVFRVVARARDAAIDRVRTAFAQKQALQGWQVDRAARDVIEQAGYGAAFCHRTGHSIGQETHGNGANMDDLETHEERRVLPRTCFSVEPGIYLPEFGVRSEANVYVDRNEQVHVTGGEPQTAVHALLKEY